MVEYLRTCPEPLDPVQRPMAGELRDHVKHDLRSLLKAMTRAPKRKFAPRWSLPLEVFLMIIDPGRLTRPAQRMEGVGLGDRPSMQVRMDFYQPTTRFTYQRLRLTQPWEPRNRLEQILIHVRQANLAPCQANLSHTFQSNKRNGKKGCPSQRIIHCFCPLWRILFR